jgi:hypothetical protein
MSGSVLIMSSFSSLLSSPDPAAHSPHRIPLKSLNQLTFEQFKAKLKENCIQRAKEAKSQNIALARTRRNINSPNGGNGNNNSNFMSIIQEELKSAQDAQRFQANQNQTNNINSNQSNSNNAATSFNNINSLNNNSMEDQFKLNHTGFNPTMSISSSSDFFTPQKNLSHQFNSSEIISPSDCRYIPPAANEELFNIDKILAFELNNEEIAELMQAMRQAIRDEEESEAYLEGREQYFDYYVNDEKKSDLNNISAQSRFKGNSNNHHNSNNIDCNHSMDDEFLTPSQEEALMEAQYQEQVEVYDEENHDHNDRTPCPACKTNYLCSNTVSSNFSQKSKLHISCECGLNLLSSRCESLADFRAVLSDLLDKHFNQCQFGQPRFLLHCSNTYSTNNNNHRNHNLNTNFNGNPSEQTLILQCQSCRCNVPLPL